MRVVFIYLGLLIQVKIVGPFNPDVPYDVFEGRRRAHLGVHELTPS